MTAGSMHKRVLTLLLILTSAGAVFAQSAREDARAGEYEGWQKIETGIFVFYAPKELKGGKRQGIDSSVYRYKSDALVLEIDAGVYAGFPSPEGKTNERHKFMTVDGATALLWFYEYEKGEWRYACGVHFTFKGLNESITMNVASKSQGGQEIAEKIFKSVKFKFKFDRKK